MGRELTTTVKCGNEKASCRVLLESAEIIVRGAIKRRFAFGAMRGLKKRAGWLEFNSESEPVAIQLDEQTAAWLKRIKNPPSRTDKLRIQSGMKTCLLGAAEPGVAAEIAAVTGSKPSTRLSAGLDVVLLFIESAADLQRLREITKSLARGGAVWVLWPKGGGELRHETVVAAASDAGLTQTISMGFSARLTGLRLVRPAKKK